MNVTGPFIRHLAFPAMEYLKHNRIRQHLAQLVDTERQDQESLRKLQTEKLKRLLVHAVQRVPAYQRFEHLLSSIEENPSAALSCFPVLTKKEFRSRRDEFLAENTSVDGLILNRSGGSTGEPVTFYMDRQTVEYSEAARWRGLSWWGIRIGDPCVMVWGSPIELNQHQVRKHRLYERILKNRIVIPAFDLNEGKLDEYIRRMEAFRPVYLYAWPSSLELLTNLLERRGHRLRLALRAIVSTAETIHPHQRALFERVFSCPVVNEYGAREGGILGYECAYGNMHATVENSWMEVVDRQSMCPVEEGQSGILLVTDLNNFVMPRIRYRLDDVVSLVWEPCLCGRRLPLLKSLEGREDDTFVTVDGRYVNGQYFTNVARTLASIHQFQIVQTSRREVTLYLLNYDGLDEKDVDSFVDAIRSCLGDVGITMIKQNSLPPSNSGKFRAAIRMFALS